MKLIVLKANLNSRLCLILEEYMQTVIANKTEFLTADATLNTIKRGTVYGGEIDYIQLTEGQLTTVYEMLQKYVDLIGDPQNRISQLRTAIEHAADGRFEHVE